MDISGTTGPSWTDVVTALSTTALVVVAIVAGLIATSQLRLTKNVTRQKVTLDLIRSYTQPMVFSDYRTGAGGDRVLSPMQAYTNLINFNTPLPQGPITPETGRTLVSAISELTANYYMLRNYLDEVDAFYQRRLIDREFYMARHSNVVLTAVASLTRWAQLVPGSGNDAELLERLHRIGHAFETKSPQKA